MDPEAAQTELAKLGTQALQDLYNNLTQMKQFAVEQAPDVCREMVTWGVVKGSVAAIALATTTIVLAITLAVMWRIKDSDGDRIGPYLCPLFVMAFIVAMFIAWTPMACGLQAYVAPKLYLLQQIKDLMS